MMKLKWRTVFDPGSCRIYNTDKCSIPKVKEHIKKKVQSKLENWRVFRFLTKKITSNFVNRKLVVA